MDPPAELVSATVVPPAPSDPGAPEARVLWTLQYDVSTFDETLSWLEDDVEPGAARDRALCMAVLLGVSELSRFELLDDLSMYDRAIAAYPDDARLPAWLAFLVWAKAFREGDSERLEQAYDELREASREYPEFTLFALTLAVAADGSAPPELVAEARAAYDDVVAGTSDLQFDAPPTPLSRLGDWAHAPYNLPGTQVLIGDLAALAGDFETAQRNYYTALHMNLGYAWPFRGEVERRLNGIGVETLHERLNASPPQEYMFGAEWEGARGVTDEHPKARLDGRLGNGSCTMCHTALTTYDTDSMNAASVGWVRVRYRVPEPIEQPFPVFFALPGEDERPVGFAIGQSEVSGHGECTGDGVCELLVPSLPGEVFVAGRMSGGEGGAHEEERFETYTPGAFGTLRYVEVEANKVVDLTDTVLEFTPAEAWD